MPQQVSGKSQTVKVVVRCRPLSQNEKSDPKTHKQIVQVDEGARRISVENIDPSKQHLGPTKEFTFDSVFGQYSQQQSIFDDTAMPIVESVLEGYNGTIFAYGQTGTGKTFTMEGKDNPAQLQGIVPRAIRYIFNVIQNCSATTKKYLVRISFLQLYNEEIKDLMDKSKDENRPKLQIHQRPEGIKVFGLSEFVIENEKEIFTRYNFGKTNRVVAKTGMNDESSRSHSIFTIIVESQEENNGHLLTRLGKLNLVDLAGSERQSKTGVSGKQRDEAININLSLTTLGLVIQHLINPKSKHIPYRDSKLTRMLQDSLGGNTKTVMIANVGPSSYNHQETLSTLNYANRAKNIKNEVHINEDPKDALLRQFQEEIRKLREQVANSMDGVPGSRTVERIVEEDDADQIEEKFRNEQDAIKRKFEEEKAEIYKKKNMIEEEKRKLIQNIEEKEREQVLFKQNQEALIKKMKKMEEKVLCGKEEEETALARADQLKKKVREVQEKREKQRVMEEAILKKEEMISKMGKDFANLEEENADKKKQIEQKMNRLKKLKYENKELEDMYAKEIDDLQERRRILQKQLKLKKLIIEYFIPDTYRDQLFRLADWSDQHDDWVMANLEISGNSVYHKNMLLGKANNVPTFDLDQTEVTEQMREQILINQSAKLQLENHPNVYYSYSEEGLVRQLLPVDDKITKKKKGGAKRPKSKINKVEH